MHVQCTCIVCSVFVVHVVRMWCMQCNCSLWPGSSLRAVGCFVYSNDDIDVVLTWFSVPSSLSSEYTVV